MFRDNNYFSAKESKLASRNYDIIEPRVKLDDPRVHNIDKINEKIKNILKTIEGNEQEVAAYKVPTEPKINTPIHSGYDSKYKMSDK
jgi:hypothetical protein